MPEKLTNDTFAEKVLESDVPVLVDFYADWCGPCKQLAPVLADIEDKSNGAYRVFKVDTDAQSDLAVKYGIQSLPTVLAFKQGDVIDRIVGLQGEDRLLQSVR